MALALKVLQNLAAHRAEENNHTRELEIHEQAIKRTAAELAEHEISDRETLAVTNDPAAGGDWVKQVDDSKLMLPATAVPTCQSPQQQPYALPTHSTHAQYAPCTAPSDGFTQPSQAYSLACPKMYDAPEYVEDMHHMPVQGAGSIPLWRGQGGRGAGMPKRRMVH